MEAEATGFWGVFAVYATVAAIIWGGFNTTDRLLRPGVKKHITAWVRGMARSDPGDAAPSWPDTFIDVFDRLLVPAKRRGWRFPLPTLWRSAVASYIAVALMAVLYATLSPDFRAVIAREPGLIISYAIVALILNLLPDYLSLWETRCVLHLMGDHGAVGRVCWLIADALITVAITYIAIIIGVLLASGDFDKIYLSYIKGLLLYRTMEKDFSARTMEKDFSASSSIPRS